MSANARPRLLLGFRSSRSARGLRSARGRRSRGGRCAGSRSGTLYTFERGTTLRAFGSASHVHFATVRALYAILRKFSAALYTFVGHSGVDHAALGTGLGLRSTSRSKTHRSPSFSWKWHQRAQTAQWKGNAGRNRGLPARIPWPGGLQGSIKPCRTSHRA